MDHRKNPNYGGGAHPKKTGNFISPKKSGAAAPARTQVNLITNNFKIKS